MVRIEMEKGLYMTSAVTGRCMSVPRPPGQSGEAEIYCMAAEGNVGVRGVGGRGETCIHHRC